MDDPRISFFMIVTDPDIVIADYSVRSYALIKDRCFQLVVYSNHVSSFLKDRYFPRWRKFEYLRIIEDPTHTEDNKPRGPELEGPFELCTTIWDRELKKLRTPYVATVDADFEILKPIFIEEMLKEMDADPCLVAMSTDGVLVGRNHYDTYSDGWIFLNARLSTWFCIYKQSAFACTVSHAYHEQLEEIAPGKLRRSVWDSSARFQQALRKDFKYRLARLDKRYQRCFIHYGAFSKNRHLNEINIGLYRRLSILEKVGILGHFDILSRFLARGLRKMLFPNVDRSKYLPEYVPVIHHPNLRGV